MIPTVYRPDPFRLREALIARRFMTPADFMDTTGVDPVQSDLAGILGQLYPMFEVEDLLLRPREALAFCDAVRRNWQCYDLPDDVILRTLRG